MRRQAATLALLLLGTPLLLSACGASDDGAPGAAPLATSTGPTASSSPSTGPQPDRGPTEADLAQFVAQCRLAMHRQIATGDRPASGRRQLEARCEAAPRLSPGDLARLETTVCVVSLTGAGPGAGLSEADARQRCHDSVRRGADGPGSVLGGALAPSASGP